MNNAKQLEDDLGQIRSLALGELPAVAERSFSGLAARLSQILRRALDESISDEEFTQIIKRAVADPQLLRGSIDADRLADWLERSMGTAAASGVLRVRDRKTNNEPR